MTYSLGFLSISIWTRLRELFSPMADASMTIETESITVERYDLMGGVNIDHDNS